MRAYLQVDLKALKHNTKILSKITGPGFFCPIIKANAYGHGALEVFQTLRSIGVQQVGVVSIEEALKLDPTGGGQVLPLEKGAAGEFVSTSKKGVKHKTSNQIHLNPTGGGQVLPLEKANQDMAIYILGPVSAKHIPWLKLYGFIPIVGEWEGLKALAHFLSIEKKALPFHLKFNTGMNRFGFLLSEKKKLLNFIQKHPYLQLEGLASHLSEGEKAGSHHSGSAFQQIQAFKKIYDFFKSSLPHKNLKLHLLNSSGGVALWCHKRTKDLSLGFRPGISLYGLKPPVDFFSKEAKSRYKNLPLKPVASLKSFVVHAYSLLPGQKVSYEGEWQAQKKSTLAVVSMGYADGLPFRLYKKGEVLFRGERVRIRGRICMDFFMIDVTQQALKKKIQVGEEVVIFGPQKKSVISLEEHSEKVQSIPEEFLTRLGHRVKRVFKN